MKQLRWLILIPGFALPVLAGWWLASGSGNLKLDQYAPLPAGGDFSLQSNTGPVSLSDFKGKLVLVYFGYTYCPDICPTSLALTSAALTLLPDSERAQVQALFISVDPARDTPDRLAEYAGFFHPNILGITGSKTEIDEIAQRYGAYYRIEPGNSAAGYLIDHSSQTVLVGKDGAIKATIAHGTLPEPMTETIRQHL